MRYLFQRYYTVIKMIKCKKKKKHQYLSHFQSRLIDCITLLTEPSAQNKIYCKLVSSETILRTHFYKKKILLGSMYLIFRSPLKGSTERKCNIKTEFDLNLELI